MVMGVDVSQLDICKKKNIGHHFGQLNGLQWRKFEALCEANNMKVIDHLAKQLQY
jgi:hypothetical protein